MEKEKNNDGKLEFEGNYSNGKEVEKEKNIIVKLLIQMINLI